MFIARRKFIRFLILGSIPFLGISNYLNNNSKITLNKVEDNLKRNEIIKYNQLRKYKLINNLNDQVLEDFKNNKTIWIDKKLVSYAELSIFF